ncbi:hypothetical protein HD554DRAFT_1618484 [Boletus coccyginus]|nr:hypothetical protein HD554DRAFT_1618484 [Boletus coccyginus]
MFAGSTLCSVRVIEIFALFLPVLTSPWLKSSETHSRPKRTAGASFWSKPDGQKKQVIQASSCQVRSSPQRVGHPHMPHPDHRIPRSHFLRGLVERCVLVGYVPMAALSISGLDVESTYI